MLPRVASVPISLMATAKPTATLRPPEPTLRPKATPIACAVIVVVGASAVTLTSPVIDCTVDAPRTRASTMLLIALPEPVPAPANVRPNLPLPPEAICAAAVPASVKTSMIAVEVALTVTSPVAISVESSTVARTSLAMSLTAAVTPIPAVSCVLEPLPPVTMSSRSRRRRRRR